jgi:predicted cupin superfamily sugar epimerase
MHLPDWRKRIDDLIAALALTPHPEGGYYRQTFRSTSVVQPDDGRSKRSALTTIYFLLTEGDVSCWHRVASDEAWHYYEGAPLELVMIDGNDRAVSRHWLGRLSDSSAPAFVVPAGVWQAARSTGHYTLVGCTVGPGFEFEDFEMMRGDGAEAQRLLEQQPELRVFLQRQE